MSNLNKQYIDTAIGCLKAAQENLDAILQPALESNVTIQQVLEDADEFGTAVLVSLLIRTAVEELQHSR